MIIRVHAPALCHLRPALRLADPARPVIGIQGRRAARAAARGGCAASDQSAAPAGPGRPGGPRRADPAAAARAADAPIDHPRYRPALAPPPDHPPLDLPAPGGTAAGQRRDHRADPAARHREPRLGIQENSGRAAQARLPGRRVHDPPGPHGAEDPSGTATAHRYDVADVPAHSGIDDARHRFLPCGLRGDPAAPVLPVRHGGRLPLRAHPRYHREPGRPVDHPADPQAADRSGRSRRGLSVPGPRPGRAVHWHVRYGAGRGPASRW